MELWASRYGSQCQFLMCCVDSVGVAIAFGRMFGLQKVVNSFIPSRGYMPVGFGQLGCSGFVVSDKDGCFVSRKTKAYLQFGNAAFSDVEELLYKHFGIWPSSNESSGESREEDVLSPNWNLPSVGIKSMDDEHEKCEHVLALLLKMPNVETLTKTLEVLTEHFQHEEELMRASGFGSPGELFSPYANHVDDHERILDLGYAELTKLSRKADPSREAFQGLTCAHTQEDGKPSS
mmetsp:Transcript_20175/g.42344  ORF Transcript_20175/g.42344 Transcript_20175/m.42344 type:complete len:234 (-) Transcript_20175:223-924(-)